jgi:hypothetical protein
MSKENREYRTREFSKIKSWDISNGSVVEPKIQIVNGKQKTNYLNITPGELLAIREILCEPAFKEGR